MDFTRLFVPTGTVDFTTTRRSPDIPSAISLAALSMYDMFALPSGF